MPQVIFVTLAYNEEANLGRLLHDLSRLDTHPYRKVALVIDDGSRDRTRAIALEEYAGLPVEVVSHASNCGVGHGFRTAFSTVLRTYKAGAVIMVEADNTCDLSIVPALLAQLANGSDVSLASCYAPGGRVTGTTPYRVFLSRAANFLIRWRYGFRGIHTYSAFYRAYRLEALRRAFDQYGENFIQENGFVCAVETLVKLKRLGCSISEVPVLLDGSMRNGISKMRTGRTALEYCRFVVRDLFL